MRAYELARALGVTSKELLAKAQELGLPVTNQLKSVTEEQAQTLRSAFAPPPSTPPPTTVTEEPRAAPKVKPPKKPKPTTKRVEPAAATPEEEPPRRRRPRPIGRVREEDERLPTPRVAEPRARAPRRARVVRRPVAAPRKKPVSMAFPVSVREFSSDVGVKASLIIRRLLDRGTPKAINDVIEEEEGLLLARDLGVAVEARKHVDLEKELLVGGEEGRPEDLVLRAPVVTLMGHVDHGKTSLLDRIRQSSITESEHGGITQHIGAYRVRSNDHTIVFLDTPGHEAFTAMRARGAQATDLVVLVVAADDGVMPQTEEAISHARAAEVPIVVAVNKVDRPDANPTQVKQQLSALGLMPEEWGGKTIVVETSAITGEGLSSLLEMLVLEAELLELKASPSTPARGVVLEAKLTAGRGVVATILVQEGTLRAGNIILCGENYGRVRSLTSERGEALAEAGPSTPAEVTGLTGVPEAGDRMYVLGDLQKAKEIVSERERRRRLAVAAPRRHVSLEDLKAQVEAGERKELPVVVKADVQGSVEVVKEQLGRMSTEEVRLEILHAAVGDVSEGDVLLADASDAVIIGFNVAVEPAVAAEARQRGVEVRLYQVIYELTDQMRRALEGMLEPEHREVALGEAEVRQLFQISRLGTIAGCAVTRGVIRRNARVRLRRADEVIFDGALDSLRRFKNDVSEVAEGYECGLKLSGFNDVREGDVIEAYIIEEVARTL